MLPIRSYGLGPGVVALHGFSLTGAQFDGWADRLGKPVHAPDLPGHGGARHSSTDWPSVLESVRVTLDGYNGPLIGYSQGARVALASVIAGHTSPSTLILVSGNPGIREDEERDTRRIADRDLAQTILTDGLEAFLDSWTSGGLTSTADLDVGTQIRDREVRLENSAEGLAAALVGYGQGAMPPLWEHLDEVGCRVLLITGSRDAKYTDIADEMEALLPNAAHINIEGAGHNPLLSHPDQTAHVLRSFLDG